MKKAQSEMVATVLLIMITIVAAVLVITFSQKSTKNVSEKIVEIGSGVECNDIRLSLNVIDGNLILKNRGTLGIDKVVVRKYSGANVNVQEFSSEFANGKLLPNVEFNAGSAGSFDKIEAKPIFKNEEGSLLGCGEIVYVP